MLLFGLCALLSAQHPVPGKIADAVPCTASPGKSYALYLPSNYTADQSWPILYCLDPGGRGRVPVERFAKAAEAEGWIVAGSNDSRNGPPDPIREAISAMTQDTYARFRIDQKRVYAAGHSGGSRVALGWASAAPIAGVVACGAGPGQSDSGRSIKFLIYAVAGVDDFNYHELHNLSLDMAKRNLPHRFADFPGGHEWLPESLTLEALQFFSGRVPSKSAVASKTQSREFENFRRMSGQLLSAEERDARRLAQDLLKQAAQPEDSSQRRVARRVIGSAFIGSMEKAREQMRRKDYTGAAQTWETAVMVRPEAAGGWYSLAVASAAARNRKRALEAFDQAVRNGFTDWARAEAEPLLAGIRSDSRYQALRSAKVKP